MPYILSIFFQKLQLKSFINYNKSLKSCISYTTLFLTNYPDLPFCCLGLWNFHVRGELLKDEMTGVQYFFLTEVL